MEFGFDFLQPRFEQDLPLIGAIEARKSRLVGPRRDDSAISRLMTFRIMSGFHVDTGLTFSADKTAGPVFVTKMFKRSNTRIRVELTEEIQCFACTDYVSPSSPDRCRVFLPGLLALMESVKIHEATMELRILKS